MEDEPQERTHTQQGTVYVFANVYMYPEKPGITGKIKKFDVLTGKTDVGNPGSVSELGRHAWSPTAASCSTAPQRRLPRRRPQVSGKVLWQPQARLGHHRQPDHLQGEGQAVRVDLRRASAAGSALPVTAGLDLNDKFGAIGATAMAKATGLDKIPQAGMLYTFRLSSD